MHVCSICNIKTPEDKFTPNKTFSIFKFLIAPFGSGASGGHNICIKNCHSRVTLTLQGDPELMLLVSQHLLCLARGLRS